MVMLGIGKKKPGDAPGGDYPPADDQKEGGTACTCPSCGEKLMLVPAKEEAAEGEMPMGGGQQ